MGLLRMRAAINLPAQMEQRRSFWWGHDTVGNKTLNYIVSIMGTVAHARSDQLSCADRTEALLLVGTRHRR
jgi:hypothetical protein